MIIMNLAHIINGQVFELLTVPTGTVIGTLFHPALVWVDVTAVSPAPQVGWTATETNGVWSFAAPVVPAPTLAQQAGAALYAGMTLTLSGSLTLAATVFPCDPLTQAKIAGVATTINTTGGFPGGVSTYPMKDMAGAWHVFTLSQYKAVAGTIAAYASQLDVIVDGNPLGATVLPAASQSLTV